MSAKSYWMPVSVRTSGDKKTIMSWFLGLEDDLRPVEAHVLVDKATDREKELRVRAIDGDGKRFELVRTMGSRFSISRKALT